MMKLKAIEIGLFSCGDSGSRRDLYLIDCGSCVNPEIEEKVRRSNWGSDSFTVYGLPDGCVIAFYELNRGFSVRTDSAIREMGESAFVFRGTFSELAKYMADENSVSDSEDNNPRIVGEVEVEI